MKSSLVIPALCMFLVPSLLTAAPATPAPIVDPPELITLRDAYTAALAPLRTRMEEAIKIRSAQYAQDLQRVEEQAVTSKRIEAVPLIRAEREAFANGNWTIGYGKDDKKVPPAANELRRAYDRDTAKIRADIIPSARPLLNDYLRKLDGLEQTFISKRNVDSALAVRREKQGLQGAGTDPLGGTNSLIVGKWAEDKGGGLDFSPDGRVPGGKWFWTDRSRRALRINWNAGPKFYLELVISPDGTQMGGVNADGGRRNFTRKER